MLQIKTLDPNLQSLFIVQPTDVTCNINVLPRQIGINMSACLCIWFVVPCKDTNYNGQYNNFNAILWTFFVVLRAKDVFVKYGNCHEHSHKTLVPKKDIQVGIFPFKNRLITSHSYKMASNMHPVPNLSGNVFLHLWTYQPSAHCMLCYLPIIHWTPCFSSQFSNTGVLSLTWYLRHSSGSGKSGEESISHNIIRKY